MVDNQIEWDMAFIIPGYVAKVIYEVPEMPIDYLENDSEDTFNGIRFNRVNGNVYINRDDLKSEGITP
ncbi:hypothetical protein U5N28_16330 [Lysinibacillus telephonicus]